MISCLAESRFPIKRNSDFHAPDRRWISPRIIHNYCINQEASLKAFLEDGDIPMDNNATESALRSFCLHKHTWKLIDSLDGANASAIIYSITETAKANNLNPFRYLEYVLTVLKDHQDDRDYGFIDDILPWSEKLPEICRNKAKTTNI